jgi:N-dimethylarginine dimethylaminohydrolase
MRTNQRAQFWLQDKFEIECLGIKMEDEYLYHTDCLLLPLSASRVLCATDAMRKQDVKAIEKIAEVIPVPKAYTYSGWTNSIVIDGILLVYCNDPNVLSETVEMPVKEIGISEFSKSGADLSCMCAKLPPLDF